MFKNPVLEKLPNDQYRVLLGEYGDHPDLFFRYDVPPLVSALLDVESKLTGPGFYCGELNHPKLPRAVTIIDESRVCFAINALTFEVVTKKRGQYVRIMAIITPTGPLGDQFRQLLEGNELWRFGLRSLVEGSGHVADAHRRVETIITWDVIQAIDMGECVQFKPYPSIKKPKHLIPPTIHSLSKQLLLQVIRDDGNMPGAELLDTMETVKIQLPADVPNSMYYQALVKTVIQMQGWMIIIQPNNNRTAEYTLVGNVTTLLEFTSKLQRAFQVLDEPSETTDDEGS